jgi:transcriptional regulator with XRE-family HTH domain
MNLRSLREARGLGLREAAVRAGISKGHLSCIERGLRHPSVGVVARLLRALGASASEQLDVYVSLSAPEDRQLAPGGIAARGAA